MPLMECAPHLNIYKIMSLPGIGIPPCRCLSLGTPFVYCYGVNVIGGDVVEALLHVKAVAMAFDKAGTVTWGISGIERIKSFIHGILTGQAREARRKMIEDMNPEVKAAYEKMRFYKFYPVSTPDTPDINSCCKVPFINIYYGKAHQVL